MAYRFKKVDYEKSLEQTITIREYLPEDHLARFIVGIIALLDPGFSHFTDRALNIPPAQRKEF